MATGLQGPPAAEADEDDEGVDPRGQARRLGTAEPQRHRAPPAHRGDYDLNSNGLNSYDPI